jgi:hypothetical protein
MRKSVYICGDSFAVSDPEYGKCWVDILSEQYSVTNLARVCASNLGISRQADIAIAAMPDYIICLGTSCTRYEFRINDKIVPISIHSVDDTTPFNNKQQIILRDYFTEFFDLEIAIYENKCIIENTLQKLCDSKIRFKFDTGGFEHKSYCTTDKTYFEKYKDYITSINLWDYASSRTYRPYFHITDVTVHEQLATYYIDSINE